MSIINFNQLFIDLKTGVETIAKDSLKNYEDQAKKDGTQAIDEMKANLLQWTKELETGSITKEDLADLLLEEASMEKMVALKQAGLAEVNVDKFRNDIINMVVSTITGLVKI